LVIGSAKKFLVLAGYRVLSVDYEKDATVYDVKQSGVDARRGFEVLAHGPREQ
jgi:hypothetical protein